MAEQALDQAYRGASEALVEKLRSFREGHEPEQVAVEDELVGEVTWEYITGGDGDETILFIPGVAHDAESHFLQIAELEEDFSVITVTIPAVPRMAAVTAGLVAVLDAEGVERVNPYGVDFGGMVAQAFLIHHHERVGDLILSHTTVPREESVEHYQSQRMSTREMPQFLFKNMNVMGMMQSLNKDVPAFRPDEQRFWQTYLENIYPDRIGKGMFLARLDAAADFHQNYEMPTGGPEDWDGRVLILESDRDMVMNRDDRQALRDCFPEAQVYTVSEYGHTGPLVRTDEYVPPSKTFLKR